MTVAIVPCERQRLSRRRTSRHHGADVLWSPFLIGLLCPRLVAQGQATVVPLAFTHVTVIDVAAGRRLPDQTVVVAGNRVQTVGAAGQVRVPAGARVVSAQGKYLIPGLWDMHAHIWIDPRPRIKYPVLIANGITGIRDMGMHDATPVDSSLSWRQAIVAGERVGPRMVLGYLLDYANDSLRVRDLVDSAKAAGYDFIKVYSQVRRDAYFAIVAEAHRLRMPFAGHLPDSVTAEEASNSGQRSLEHVEGHGANSPCGRADTASERQCAALAARFVRNGTWWTPTLTVMNQDTAYDREQSRYYQSPGEALGQRGWFTTIDPVAFQQVVRMHRLGMPLLAGTDGGPIFGLVQTELEKFVKAGLTPLEALRTATLNPAMYFDATDSLGTVAAGKLADLVLLDADPLVDVRNTRKICAVVADGRYFDRIALDKMLAEADSLVAAGD